MSRVLVLDAGYDDLSDIVQKVFSEFPLQLKGKRVLVKPNMLGPYAPARGITTHPALVKAVVAHLLSAGARVVVGDNPGFLGYGENERCGRVTGILEASRGCFVNIGARPCETKIHSMFTNKVAVAREVITCDVLISLPKMKTHMLTIVTGGMKNSYGFLSGREKVRLHGLARSQRDFAEVALDVFSLRVPDLVIMDGIVAMEGNGPNAGSLRKVGKILASDNAVSLDAVMAWMMGMEPGSVDMLRIAHDRGMGEIDIGKISVAGRIARIPHFRLPATAPVMATHLHARDALVSALVGRISLSVDQKRCVKCGVCVKSCPVSAISRGERVTIDAKRCIRCYCCKELCPHSAIEAHGLIVDLRRLVGGRM